MNGFTVNWLDWKQMPKKWFTLVQSISRICIKYASVFQSLHTIRILLPLLATKALTLEMQALCLVCLYDLSKLLDSHTLIFRHLEQIPVRLVIYHQILSNCLNLEAVQLIGNITSVNPERRSCIRNKSGFNSHHSFSRSLSESFFLK